jgi:superfamily II DNA helicase RecQ
LFSIGLKEGSFNIIFTSPEALLGEDPLHYEDIIKTLNIVLVAYDEAHVILEW